jgi:succinate-semialdehyde dehydrogenase/glutarate-semialdehyde dehydrogenase
LGGNDAFVLLETSNIDEAIGHAIKGRFSNHGQKCNSSKRFIIIESMYNVFCERFAESVSKLKV